MKPIDNPLYVFRYRLNPDETSGYVLGEFRPVRQTGPEFAQFVQCFADDNELYVDLCGSQAYAVPYEILVKLLEHEHPGLKCLPDARRRLPSVIELDNKPSV